MPQVALDTPLAPVVGPPTAKAMEKSFGVLTVGDALWHLPRRYSRRGELTPLRDLPLGEHVTVVAQVLSTVSREMAKRRGSILEAKITDGNGILTLTYFNQKFRAHDLLPGRRGIFSGKVTAYQGQLQLQHPNYELFENRDEAPGASQLDEAAAKAWAETPVPIYPASAKVASWTVQKTLGVVLDSLSTVPDPLPQHILRQEGIISLHRAFEQVHRPQRESDAHAARDSLRFREAFELQLALLDRRRRSAQEVSTAWPSDSEPLRRFDAALPFELTGDQRLAGAQIAADLAAPHPMHRLLQGEVGSGKTLVALRAMLQVAGGGGQSALLAPTEVLAAQHFRSITEALGPELAAELHPVLLTGRMPAAERKKALLALAAGASRIAVGTHALLGESVMFADLGLIVVDEQHRFGVEQRETLRRKGSQPHVLAMTATPIPRTVALTAFGDLEVTTIRELPPGRLGIETFAVPEIEMPGRAARVWARAAEDLAAGRQVYVVCPAIAPGEVDPGLDPLADAPDAQATEQRPLASVEETVAELRARADFAQFPIAGLHGGMPGPEKDSVMRGFAGGEIRLLVATTVIEVGVNVPNATIMIVRDADRFGISQLHQLRGRVGRGSHAGLCLLMTRAEQGSTARARIDAVAETADGFALAEVDLQLRREGDILGTEQSGGRSTLRLLRVAEHGELIVHSREIAATLLEQDPELTSAPELAAMLERQRTAGALDNLAKS
ncbi:ATP-dependent DNA helicase RecG [Leucobacter luti]|uniref:ATP-dependent DNA helicase RecG n=1 Tax=Leucobacter luti TaxID=340320 RepID=UPI001049AB28|nr:ATP-dependent DNA helicase RecG [Leucobacter luti]MCW2288024.1 ATP-dependent DNA helicase RecG [Leucobacter luti]TCK45814.1 ATP-dependent DNA helicase RecG [Leucobacter luti]